MEMFSITNTLALFAFIALFIPVYRDLKEKKKLVTSNIVLISLVGITVFILTIIKNNKDSAFSTENKTKIDSLNKLIDRIEISSDSALDKLDTLNIYVKRIDSLGFRRNPITNEPYKLNQTNNLIQNVTSSNQKGGQTAGIINNH